MAINLNVPLATNQIASDLVAMNANWEFVDQSISTIWIPAIAMLPTVTDGAFAGSWEYTSNDIVLGYYSFQTAAERYTMFSLVMPDGWNLSTIKAKFYWAPGGACAAGETCEWELNAVAVSNDDTLDAAAGGSQVISDTVLAGTNGDLHITEATPAITISGTPALGDLINFKVSRNVLSAGDNMSVAAWLFGVRLQINTTVSISATGW